MTVSLSILVGLVAIISWYLSINGKQPEAFFRGKDSLGQGPSLLTLTFSQVTTWIFARSLMNAAILGFYYGIWGTVAYAIYYLSFITGGLIVEHVRFRQGYESIQSFINERFGKVGSHCYNTVISIRLISEVFANLLVIGLLFGVAGTFSYTIAIVSIAFITLTYSMLGGLKASLSTDVLQMVIFIIVLLVLLISILFSQGFDLSVLSYIPFKITEPGPILMLVAVLQVWSYPMHDPVMMDRGFISDRSVTRRSFLHATWISIICILAFGYIGILAGYNALENESMNEVLSRMFGNFTMFCFSATLIVSAMSTLDSTLSSSSKLLIMDMNLLPQTVNNGRLIMISFMLIGLILVFVGNKDLFSAVAVSGTASLFLFPVVVFSLFLGIRQIPVWSYIGSFSIAVIGATLYFIESSGYSSFLGEAHKYTKLLCITIFVMVTGCLLFFVGFMNEKKSNASLESSYKLEP